MTSAITAPPRIQLLGAGLLQLPGQPSTVLAPKDAVLLAHLALHGAGARDALAALLWQDRAPAMQRANLRQRIKRLQDASRQQLFALQGDKLALASRVEHDLALMPQALLASPQACPGALLGGLQLADSPTAAQWLDGARQRVHAQRLHTLQAQADALEHSGQLDAALGYTARLLAEEPLQEQGHRQLIRLHYQRGEKAAALAAYQRLFELLAAELKHAPDEQTQALARLVESAQAPAPPRALPSVAPLVRDPGVLAAGVGVGAAVSPGNNPAVSPAVSPAAWAALLRPPKLLQREAEWQQLSQTWTDGGICIVLGEAGMGKTRLLNDFANSVALPLRLQARLGDQAVPYALLSRWITAQLSAAQALPDWARSELARLAPELGSAPPGKLMTLRLVKALALLQPPAGAVLLDDLHHADDATLELLPAVLQTVRCSLLGARPDEMPTSGSWIHGPAQPRQGQAPLVLQPWSKTSIDQLLQSVFSDVKWPDSQPSNRPNAGGLHLLSGGKPLLFLELLRLQLSTPQGDTDRSFQDAPEKLDLHRLIKTRLKVLKPQALRLVRLAALAGADFTPTLAAQASGLHELDLVDAWQELERLQLFSAHGLAHDVLAEVVAHDVPQPVASALHGRVAELLASTGTAEPARIAQNWAKAGRPDKAWPHWSQAAELAHKASRYNEELKLLTLAQDCAQQSGLDEAAFELALRAINAAKVVCSAHETRQRIGALRQQVLKPRWALKALLAHCKHLLECSETQAALEPCQQVWRDAKQFGDEHQQLRAAAWCGLALAFSGQAAEAAAVFDEVSAFSGACQDLLVKADYVGALGYFFFVNGNYAQALPALGEAAVLAEQLGDLREAMVQQTNVSVCRSMLGERQAACDAADWALKLWHRQGEPTSVDAAACHMHAAAGFAANGQYGQALKSLRWAGTAFQEHQQHNWATKTSFRLSRLYSRLGRADLARTALLDPGPHADAGTRLIHLAYKCRLATQHQAGLSKQLQTEIVRVGSDISRTDRLLAELVLAAALPASDGLPRIQHVLAQCEDGQESLVRVHALARLADTLHRLNSPTKAAASALSAWAAFDSTPPIEMENLEFWWLIWQPLQAAGFEAESSAVLKSAQDWIAEALIHTPNEFRDSFLNRNPFVSQLLAAAHRHLQSPTTPAKRQAAHHQ